MQSPFEIEITIYEKYIIKSQELDEQDQEISQT